MYTRDFHRHVGGLGNMDAKDLKQLSNITDGLGRLDVNFKGTLPEGLGNKVAVYSFKYPLEETGGLGEPSGIPFRMALPEGIGNFDAK